MDLIAQIYSVKSPVPVPASSCDELLGEYVLPSARVFVLVLLHLRAELSPNSLLGTLPTRRRK